MLNSFNNVNNGYWFKNNCDIYCLGGVLKSIFSPRKFIGSDISRESSIVRTFRNMKENARKKIIENCSKWWLLGRADAYGKSHNKEIDSFHYKLFNVICY